MNTLKALTISSAFALTALPSAEAKVRVDPMFTDHLVLQRDASIPVWGKADRGETVTVEYLPSKGSKNPPQKVEAETSEDGRWRAVFRPLSADGSGGKLIITGDKTEGSPTVLEDVLVGEVWLGSGQSNMAYGTRHYAEYDPDLPVGEPLQQGRHAGADVHFLFTMRTQSVCLKFGRRRPSLCRLSR